MAFFTDIKTRKDLDKYQEEVVNSQHPFIKVMAHAGSGKTTTAIEAIIRYSLQNPMDRICFITYTRAARADMEAKLVAAGARKVEVTTIHVWARNQLDKLGKEFNFTYSILSEQDIKDILLEIIERYGEKLNPSILFTFVTGNKNMGVAQHYRKKLEKYDRLYVEYKRANHLYDFTDYPLLLWEKLVQYGGFIADVDAFFVDELQDVDSIQKMLFNRVLASKKLFIGDPRQSIFLFRGADGKIFNELPGFKAFSLMANYRSYQEIIDFADAVYTTVEASNYKTDLISKIRFLNDACKIECKKGFGGRVFTTTPFGYTSELKPGNIQEEIDIKEVADFMFAQSSLPMILCRTNKQVKELADLGYTLASTVHQAKGLEYDNVIVVDEEIKDIENLNVAYVAITRARDNVYVVNFSQLLHIIKRRRLL